MADKPALYRRQRDVVYADMTARHYREMIACYWGFCAFFDDLAGKLLARLDERGAADDTLVIVTSDHGESMGAHGLVYKSLSMFDESIRIPMIARWPGRIEPGRATDAPVMLHDIGPTVLEAAGAEPLAGVHGESLVGTMTGSGHDLERAGALVESEGAHVRITQRTLVRGPFKYVFNAFDYDELYNLEEDPGELHNLAQDPRHAHTVREMATALTDELVRLGDHLPTVRQPHTNLLPVGPDADYRSEGTGG
jgi:arylsulfatase A-like enzyme